MMHHVTLFFEPLDVLVFRDHRPFMAGQHFFARGVYPLPSVFFGALRAALFEGAGVRFVGRNGDPFAGLSPEARKVLGDADDPGKIELSGPLLARRDGPSQLDVYLPWPRDLDLGKALYDDSNNRLLTREVHPVTPSQTRGIGLRWRHGVGGPVMSALDGPLPENTTRPDGKPSKERYLLTAAGAEKYAHASAAGESSFQLSTKDNHLCEEADLIIKERRTGIARARADEGIDPLTVDESMLYTIETWRLAMRVGFAIDVSLSDDALQHEKWLHSQLKALDGVTLRLGGKGHLARVHLLDRPLFTDLDSKLPKPPAGTKDVFKAWNLTPSLLDPAHAHLMPAMVLGDTIRLGGVNLRRGKDRPIGPRPLIGALAPGSILVYEGAHDPHALDNIINTANERGEDHGHFRRAGYGIHRLLPYRCPGTGASQ